MLTRRGGEPKFWCILGADAYRRADEPSEVRRTERHTRVARRSFEVSHIGLARMVVNR